MQVQYFFAVLVFGVLLVIGLGVQMYRHSSGAAASASGTVEVKRNFRRSSGVETKTNDAATTAQGSTSSFSVRSIAKVPTSSMDEQLLRASFRLGDLGNSCSSLRIKSFNDCTLAAADLSLEAPRAPDDKNSEDSEAGGCFIDEATATVQWLPGIDRRAGLWPVCHEKLSEEQLKRIVVSSDDKYALEKAGTACAPGRTLNWKQCATAANELGFDVTLRDNLALDHPGDYASSSHISGCFLWAKDPANPVHFNHNAPSQTVKTFIEDRPICLAESSADDEAPTTVSQPAAPAEPPQAPVSQDKTPPTPPRSSGGDPKLGYSGVSHFVFQAEGGHCAPGSELDHKGCALAVAKLGLVATDGFSVSSPGNYRANHHVSGCFAWTKVPGTPVYFNQNPLSETVKGSPEDRPICRAGPEHPVFGEVCVDEATPCTLTWAKGDQFRRDGEMHPKPTYYLLRDGSSACPSGRSVSSAAQCARAAKERGWCLEQGLSETSSGTFSADDHPSGCIVRQDKTSFAVMWNNGGGTSKGAGENVYPVCHMDRPHVAILTPTTTRTMNLNTVRQMTLVTKLIPSIQRTVEPRLFRYTLFIALDHDDWAAKQKSVLEAMSTDELQIEVIVVQKSGNFVLAVNGAAAQITRRDITYIVRINDDSLFETRGWASIGAETLASYDPPNTGVVGPRCDEGRRDILTHDMTHIDHYWMWGFYYPPEFENWWIDNWVTFVYPTERRVRLAGWKVKHHSAHGTRYKFDPKTERRMDLIDSRDRPILDEWIAARKKCAA